MSDHDLRAVLGHRGTIVNADDIQLGEQLYAARIAKQRGVATPEQKQLLRDADVAIKNSLQRRS